MSDIKNTATEFLPGDVTFHLAGPTGRLEVLSSAPTTSQHSVVAIICHPHPLFGGTMHNKVVYTIARAFKEMSIRTVRFNFRGVGTSEGSYDQGIGETDDLLAVLRWVKQVRPNDAIWLAGFSFGSYVAARAANLWPTEQLVSVAPPVVNFDFASLPEVRCPWLIIQGDLDEVVAPDAVYTWYNNLKNPPELIRMPEASHFFHGQLIELREILIKALLPKLRS